MQKFGRLLHPVQDFYANTNWIEQGRADIFENSVGQWPLLGSYSINNNAIMIEGNPPPGYIAAANMASKTILVRISNTAPFLGIASGVYPNDNDETHCPAFFRVSHGDQNGRPTDLNKDNPTRAGFAEARALAVKQTTHEWCRLVNLVEQRYGQAGVEYLFNNWVADPNAAHRECFVPAVAAAPRPLAPSPSPPPNPVVDTSIGPVNDGNNRVLF